MPLHGDTKNHPSAVLGWTRGQVQIGTKIKDLKLEVQKARTTDDAQRRRLPSGRS
jgi:hypothetical protein